MLLLLQQVAYDTCERTSCLWTGCEIRVHIAIHFVSCMFRVCDIDEVSRIAANGRRRDMFQVITGVDAPEMYTVSFRLSEVFQAVSDSMIVNVRWACTEINQA